jgi:ppGpp synthetase/RelA/SpoT-type nucleotidyltranferase
MGLVEDFIIRYRREYDFYDHAARLARQMLDGRLQAAGVRSIVTSRAKSVTRLGPKVTDRATRRNYQTVADIYDDIVDLAGVRVALYFPGERSEVDTIVRQLFMVDEPVKNFPEDGSPPKYKKRFAGYSATHYRVHLRETSLSESEKRYAEARIEIQVASVLMHAWSEVEHDLVYKPLQGQLSLDEYEILDELNGLVMVGEIALERLQRAGEQRVAISGRPFGNHYELAAHLLGAAGGILKDPVSAVGMGRIDLLFDLLNAINLKTPAQLAKYVDALHADTDTRPVAEQVIDQLLAEDASRYDIYKDLRAREATREDGPSDVHRAVGSFVATWAEFERVVLSKLPREALKYRQVPPPPQLLANMGLISSEDRDRLEPIRRLRNMVVHGQGPDNVAQLQEATEILQQLTTEVKKKHSQDIAPPGPAQLGNAADEAPSLAALGTAPRI